MNIVYEELTKYIKNNKDSLGFDIEYKDIKARAIKRIEDVEHIALKIENIVFAFLNTKGQLDIPYIEFNSNLKKTDKKRNQYLVFHFKLKENDLALRIHPIDINGNNINSDNFNNYINDYLTILEEAYKKRIQ